MPFVRTLRDRVEKFSTKVVSDVVRDRFTQVETIAKGRVAEGLSPVVNIRELTRKILEEAGVPSGQHAVYYSYAFKAASKALSHSGETLNKELEGLKAMWVTAYGADPTIIDKIIKLVTGM